MINEIHAPLDRKSWSYNNLIGQTPVTESWTPAFSFATPGDLSASYSVQVGRCLKIGRLIVVTFVLTTTAFTHTTASGNLLVTGLLYTPRNQTNYFPVGSVTVQGVTKANYTNFVCFGSPGQSYIEFDASASAQSKSNIAAADVPTGGSLIFAGNLIYETD